METPYDTSPLIGPGPEDRERLNRPMVYGVIGGVMVLAVGTLFVGVQRWMFPPAPPAAQAVELPAMTQATPPLEPFIQVPTSFANLDRRPTPPPMPAMPPMFPKLPVAEQPPPQETPPLPIKEVAHVPTRPPPPPPVAQKPVPKQETPATPAPPERKEHDDWLFADIKAAPRKGQGQGEGPPGAGGKRGTSQLFPAAQWEKPADPTKVIYASQILNGVLEQAIVTGESGTVRIRLTETLYDRFGQLNVLLPQYSLILANVEGANVKYGQTRVPIAVTKVELPDGTDLVLTGKGGDAEGAVGVPGNVDNRYAQVVFSAILTAATSIGTRSMTGSPSGYQYNLGQEFTANAAQSLSHSGQEIVKRSLSVEPIISIPSQSPVTIQLDKNISLQTPPRVVHR